MERHPELQKTLDKIQTLFFGRTATQAQAQNICTFCGKPATEFKDEKSKREYDITGYCQDCQDEVFDHFSECKELDCPNYEKVNGKSTCKIDNDPDDCEKLFE